MEQERAIEIAVQELQWQADSYYLNNEEESFEEYLQAADTLSSLVETPPAENSDQAKSHRTILVRYIQENSSLTLKDIASLLGVSRRRLHQLL